MRENRHVAHVVAKAMEALRPDVAYIRYSLEADWSGEESIMFRVVLAVGASGRTSGSPAEEAERSALFETSKRVQELLQGAGLCPECGRGMPAYFNYRTVAEQAAMKEPEWAAP